MGKALIAHNDLGLTATFSGGTWQDTLTPTNQLANRLITAKARTSGLSDLVLDMTLASGDDLAYDMFGLVNHNLSSSASLRIRVYYDSARTSLEYDSGIRVVSASADVEVTPLFAILSSFPITSPYIRINISDATNTDGYMEFGRIMVQSTWYPELNVAYGTAIGWDDLSEVTESTTGIEFYDRRVKRRTVKLPYQILTDVEHSQAEAIIGREGLTGEVLFCFDDTDLGVDYSRTFLARMSRIRDIRMVDFNLNTVSIDLQEVM